MITSSSQGGEKILSITPIGRRSFLSLIYEEVGGHPITPKDVDVIIDRIEKELEAVPLPNINSMEIFLADGCNLNCSYCFEGLKPKRFIPQKLAESAIDRLIEWSKDDPKISVFLFGGEPFLNWRGFKSIVSYAKNRAEACGKEIFLSTTTNGTLLNEERVRFLKTHKISLMLSIDGPPYIHDRYRRTVMGAPSSHLVERGLRLVQDYYGAEFTVRMTVMPDAAPWLFESVLFLWDKGVRQIVVRPAFGVRWTGRAWRAYWEKAHELAQYFETLFSKGETKAAVPFPEYPSEVHGFKGCMAGTTNVAVTAQGRVLPCSWFTSSTELKQNYTLGHVLEGKLNEFRRKELLLLNRQRGLPCSKCAFAQYCSGGCMAENFRTTGSLVEPDPIGCRLTALSVSFLRRFSFSSCPQDASLLEGGLPCD